MEPYLSISALQHYAYCSRQFALIHVEQVWLENRWTAEGRLLHERVDSGVPEQRGGMRFERSVMLVSHKLGLTGKADLIEMSIPGDDDNSIEYIPVEYKRGKPKPEDWDRIQLCAQALCIEEMQKTVVSEGALWYWQTRRRSPVAFNETLRQKTTSIIQAARKLFEEGRTPPPTSNPQRCRACSLIEICNPTGFARDDSKKYVDSIFADSECDRAGDSA